MIVAGSYTGESFLRHPSFLKERRVPLFENRKPGQVRQCMKFGQVQLVLYFDITGLCPYFQNLLTAADGDLVFGSVRRAVRGVSDGDITG